MADFYAGKRVLVTGGLGFIGSNLAIELVRRGAETTLVDSMIPRYGANLFNVEPVRNQVRINFSDVRDAHSLEYLVRDQDVVFSLAGQVSHLDSMRDPFTDLEINCTSQLSLLECCRTHNPAARIVFASTRQIYGRPQYLPIDEKHPLVPVDVNGINKLAAEMYYTLYRQVHGLRTVSLRLTNTYGPRMDLRSPQKGFVGVFVRKSLAGEPIELFGTGEQRRDFNYIDDVVAALLMSGEYDSLAGGSYNLGHRHPYSLREFAEILGRFAEFEHRLVPFPDDRKRIDIGDYYGDFSRFRAATGWEPRIDLPDGLERTMEFFRAHPDEYWRGDVRW
ncbi:MAG: NAD-dependent epimerase/dehydratase family protein [Planctomycetaceae bacterium]